MAPKVCIYGRSDQSIRCDDLQRFATDGLVEQVVADGMERTTVIWEHEELELITLPSDMTGSHINQLRDYISELHDDADGWLLPAIEQFRLVQSVQYRSSSDGLKYEPQPSDALRGTDLIRRIVRHYQGALFVNDSLYRESGELIAGPPSASTRLLWDQLLDDPEVPPPSELEQARWQRTRAHLERRNVPLPTERLPGYGDEKTVRTRDPQAVAERLLVVASIVRSTAGVARERKWLSEHGLLRCTLPAEQRFWKPPQSKAACREAHWHIESVWCLLWALGYIDNFNWPGLPCEEDKLAPLLDRLQQDPDYFIKRAQLRRVDEILDAIELIQHLHWAIENARRTGTDIPRYLVWTDKQDRESPVVECLAAGIVEQRFRALNWLVEGQRWC